MVQESQGNIISRMAIDNCTAMPYLGLMEFIESPLFTKLVTKYIDDGEYLALQIELVLRPEAGSIIPGSGGIRKLRWSGKGKGKRGGFRIIYYWKENKTRYGFSQYMPRVRCQIYHWIF